MTVGAFTDSANRLTFTADSSTVSYSFNFEIADENSIEVYVDNVLKSISSDYSVSFNSGTSGAGNIIFTSAPSASSSIIFKRDTLLTRETDFQTGGAFNASNINNELDRLTQGLQEADDKIQNRVLRVDNFSSAPTDFTIPSTRADMFLKFDSGGDVTVTDSFEGSTITTTGDVTVGGALNVSGSLSLSSLSVSGNVSGTLTTAAQPNITSLGTLSALTVDNISLDGNTVASSTGTLAVDDNVTVNGTIVASGAITGSTLTGTLQTAAQSNITSLGTLTALDVDNINLNGNTIVSSTGTLAIDDNTTVNGSLTATTLGGTLSTAAQTNITSLGTLTALAVDGISIDGNNITATRTNDDLNLTPSGTGQVVVNGNISATNIAGTLTTAAQTNITSLGTLTNLQIEGINIDGNNISATRTNEDLVLIPSGTGQVLVNGNIEATNIAGTLTTAAQPNITSLGTLTSLQTDNININGNTISTTSGNLTLSNLTSVSIDSINFTDNKISTNASNADLQIDANGTGTIDVLDNRISNLADAVNNKDAVSKGFLNTTLTNAGISPTGEVTFQTTIESGSSSVKVASTDGDTHITNASSLLYKFEGDEIESLTPIRLTGDGGFFANKNTVEVTTNLNTGSGFNSAIFGDLTIANGVVLTIANNTDLRVI